MPKRYSVCCLAASVEKANKMHGSGNTLDQSCNGCVRGSCWNKGTDVAPTVPQTVLPTELRERITGWPFYLCGLQHAAFVGKRKTQRLFWGCLVSFCGISAVSVIYCDEEEIRGHSYSWFCSPLQCSSFGLYFLFVLIIFLSLFLSSVLVKEPGGI